jgi:hypothetical protein
VAVRLAPLFDRVEVSEVEHSEFATLYAAL